MVGNIEGYGKKGEGGEEEKWGETGVVESEGETHKETHREETLRDTQRDRETETHTETGTERPERGWLCLAGGRGQGPEVPLTP